MSTYLNAHANVKKWILDVQFPGNWFEFGIIGNDFGSSRIWASQNQFSFSRFKNPKIRGIQPTNEPFNMNSDLRLSSYTNSKNAEKVEH